MVETKTEKTVAEELRQAAAKLREGAEYATRGPWTRTADAAPNEAGDAEGGENDIAHRHGDYLDTVALVGSGTTATADAKWICLTNPLLAEPLAAWLEETAKYFDEDVEDDPEAGDWVHIDDLCGGVVGKDCKCYTNPLAVARVLNGTAS